MNREKTTNLPRSTVISSEFSWQSPATKQQKDKTLLYERLQLIYLNGETSLKY